MGATTTAFKSLLKQLQTDFPELRFATDTNYYWSAHDKTVYFDQQNAENAPLLLHETAHGLLGHDSYTVDVELIKLEREAWTKVAELAEQYDIALPEAVREEALDSYRDWLHTRSLCPSCALNGIQTGDNHYECLVCATKWQVNDAKTCGLRRTVTS